MASYIPAQRTGPIWQSEYAALKAPPPLMFPQTSSGSRRDYGGHASGAPEFGLPTLGHIASRTKQQVTNVLLYGHGWGHLDEERMKQQLESAHSDPHPDFGKHSLTGPKAPQHPAALGEMPAAFGQSSMTGPSYTFAPRVKMRDEFNSRTPGAKAGALSSTLADLPSLEGGPGVGRPNLLEEDPLLTPRTLSRTQKRPAGMNLTRARSIFEEG